VLDPEHGAASIGLADALLRLGDTASALRWANRAVSITPRDPAARVVLGDVLFQKGEAGPAEVEWREALQLDPSNFLARRRVNRLAQSP
jgi:Flp pilus assembly protein TadD